MHPKILKDKEISDLGGAPRPGGRAVAVPETLTEAALIGRTPEEIADRLRTDGYALGAAAMARLAGGSGTTPAGTQFLAAKFLLDLVGGGGENDPGKKALSDFTFDELTELIKKLEPHALIEQK